MAYPRMQALMNEYALEIDDVRWMLSIQLSFDIEAMQGQNRQLIEEIWSGTLEGRLYRMEERFLEEQEALWNSGQIVEGKLRDFMAEARAAKRRRRR